MEIERAKMLSAACFNSLMKLRGFDGCPYGLPDGASLPELLEACRIMKGYSELNKNGGATHYMTVDDRGVALLYAYEHFGRSPATMLEILGYEFEGSDHG